MKQVLLSVGAEIISKKFWYALCVFLGGTATTLANALGGWNNNTKFMFLLMVIDFASGVICAVWFKRSSKTKTGSYNSTTCVKGFWKKVGYLSMVIIANMFQKTFGINYITDVLIYGICFNELTSIVENYGLMGMKVPTVFLNTLDVLKQKGEKAE